MSLNANVSSVSRTTVAGTSPATILQNRQSATGCPSAIVSSISAVDRRFPAIGYGTMRPFDGFIPVATPVGTPPNVPDLADDAAASVKGFASETAVSPGDSIDFHISVAG